MTFEEETQLRWSRAQIVGEAANFLTILDPILELSVEEIRNAPCVHKLRSLVAEAQNYGSPAIEEVHNAE